MLIHYNIFILHVFSFFSRSSRMDILECTVSIYQLYTNKVLVTGGVQDHIFYRSVNDKKQCSEYFQNANVMIYSVLYWNNGMSSLLLFCLRMAFRIFKWGIQIYYPEFQTKQASLSLGPDNPSSWTSLPAQSIYCHRTNLFAYLQTHWSSCMILHPFPASVWTKISFFVHIENYLHNSSVDWRKIL